MLNNILTVSQLNRYVKGLFEDNKLLANILIKGEISNFSGHTGSGHFYFSLKDAGAAVKAVMFRSYAQQLRFRPRDGQKVIVTCSVGLYERDGAYQLYVYDMQPDGAGALAVAFEQLKEKLAAEGLFDPARKKPVPRMPLRIGVVTSPAGAALQDILNVLQRRWPVAGVVLAPAQVQGEDAARQLAAALLALDAAKACDVVILARGGGSAEDLWAFNDEGLARAIHACETPVISAVGHEVDYTIADFAADLRAPTPSAAAELAAPDLQDVRCALAAREEQMLGAMGARLARLEARLASCRNHRALHSPQALLGSCEERLSRAQAGLAAGMWGRLEAQGARLARQAGLLDTLSPLAVLGRGYAIAFQGGAPLTDAAQVRPGDRVQVRLARGAFAAQVTEKTEEPG